MYAAAQQIHNIPGMLKECYIEKHSLNIPQILCICWEPAGHHGGETVDHPPSVILEVLADEQAGSMSPTPLGWQSL